MADVTIGELPSLNTMEADALIPVEHDGEAKSMSGTVLGNYVYGLVEDDVEIIAEIIAVGPKGEDGVSPTLSSSKSGKTTTIYYTDADHPTSTVLATLQDGADGTGVGDMLKSTYDQDNDGVVDDSEKLGGYAPSHYATLDSDSKITPTQATAKQVDISSDTEIAATHNGCRLRCIGTVTISVPDTLSGDFECEILNYGSGTVTIAKKTNTSVTFNGSGSNLTSTSKYDVAVLALYSTSSPYTDWGIKGDFS